ncbi:MAG: hypothetical protein JWM43_1088 [Acidobacteriaceae bacterium]|nr:hypothetical protein [Acidobacteriaceae bacterium]
MVYRPLRTIGRFVLAACAVSLGSASLNAQTAPSAAPLGPNPSRVDIFTGYSYYGAHGQLKPAGIAYSSIDLGAIGSGAYYFSKYVGLEGVFTVHPDGKNDGMSSISGGPIFRAPMQNFTVFAHGLVGGARLGGPNNSVGPNTYHEPYRWGASIAAGGGMDYDLPFFSNRFSLRLFEADYRYIHANYGPYTPPPVGGVMGGRANLSGVELSTGIVTHFGHVIPPPPVTYSCAVSPATAFPGDPITVTGTALNLNPKKTATYTWTADGGTVAGTSSTANIDTKSAAPGSYTAKGHVSEGTKPGQMADCSAPYTVKAFEPPTISCSANPSSVNPGDSATITANGVSPQNRPLTYSYSASSGSVSGNAATATLSTAGAAPGSITVTCNVVDDKGQSASSTTTVTVIAPPPPPAPKTSNLCSLNFERDARRPVRVDNEAKACLDDVALNLQRSSDAKLALVGSSDAKEKTPKSKRAKVADIAGERAVNAKAYLVTDKGIDASRVSVYSGSTDGKTVTTTLIPAGATLDSTGLTPVDETAVKAPVVKKHKK